MKKISLLVLLAVAMSTGVQAEEPSVQWTFQTAKANEAVRKYQGARKKLADTFEKTRRENLASLIEKLQEQVKAATTSNNLDEALAIRDAIKTMQAAPIDSGKVPERPTSVDGKAQNAKRPANVDLVLGTWKTEATTAVNGRVPSVWIFNPDHTVDLKGLGNGVRGVWKLEKDCVRVRWQTPPGAWDSLRFPLNQPIVSGDSWMGRNIIRATKESGGDR